MTDFNWIQYLILVGLAVLGTFAVMPYAFEMNKDKLADVPMSRPKLVLLSGLQGTILFAILTFIGLSATKSIGLSITSSFDVLPLAIIVGILAGTAIILVEYLIFRPYMPEALKKGEGHIALWKRVLASLYGGVSEEVLTRLFLMSGMAWLFGQIWQTPIGTPTAEATILAILVAAILFGIGHLPTTASLTPLTPLVIVRAIVLNGIVGILCGWLYWQYGLVAAMIAHFCADIVLHVVAPQLEYLSAKSDHRTLSHTI
jgi:hypothetical protein